jgi:hypothetical protein
MRRDLSEADRNLQAQSQKLTDLQTAGEEAGAQAQNVGPSSGKRGRSARGRRSRSFSVRSR